MENKRGLSLSHFVPEQKHGNMSSRKKKKSGYTDAVSDACRAAFSPDAHIVFHFHPLPDWHLNYIKNKKLFVLTAPPWQHAGGREQRWRLRGHLSSVRAALSGTSLTRARAAWTALLLPGCLETETICRPVTSQR